MAKPGLDLRQSGSRASIEGREEGRKGGREGGKINQARKDLGLESDLLTGRGGVAGDRCTTKGKGTISGAMEVGGVRSPAGAGGGELSVPTIPVGTVLLGPLSRIETGKGKECRTAPHQTTNNTIIIITVVNICWYPPWGRDWAKSFPCIVSPQPHKLGALTLI